jgi:MarR family transcriptional regulator, lower aerobic nicotinate degradation pathway regulator
MSSIAPDHKLLKATRVPEELLKSEAFLVARLGMLVKSRALDAFDQAGFDAYHYSLLALLAEGERETQATIADVLGVDRSQLVGILDALEERGLVERRRDLQDRRRHVVSLTPDGRRQLVKLRAIVRRVEDEFFAPLEPASRESLHDSLLRLAMYHDPRCCPE